jgi:hypothetical protein
MNHQETCGQVSFSRSLTGLGLIVCLTLSLNAQTPDRPLATDQTLERAYGSVALVLAGRRPGQPADTIGAAVVVRQNGVLLTAYHLVKDAILSAGAIQKRRGL